MGSRASYFSYVDSKTSGATILFIHGNSQSKESFLPFFESPLKEQFRLIALDLPGHGEAPTRSRSEDYSITSFSEYIKTFILELNLDQIVLAGHSFGGHICLRVAQKNQNVRGVMIWGTPPLRGLESLPFAFKQNEVGNLFFQELISVENASVLALLCYCQQDEYSIGISRNILRTDPKFRSSLFQNILNGDLTDEVEILSNLHFPALILCGENDNLVTASYVSGLQSTFDGQHTCASIPQLGHFPHFENSTLFEGLIKNYMHSLFRETTENVIQRGKKTPGGAMSHGELR